MLVQATLNGSLSKDDHPAVPISLDELARDAAGCLGLHPVGGCETRERGRRRTRLTPRTWACTHTARRGTSVNAVDPWRGPVLGNDP